jgi:hypothetical protein
VSECIAASDEKLGTEHALEWAGDFTFPTDVRTRDWEELMSKGGDLVRMIMDRRAGSRDERFNHSRLEEWPYDRVNTPKLRGLVEGIRILGPKKFVPSREPQKMRASYKKVAPAIHKMVHGMYLKGAVLIFPTDKLVELVGNLHFSVISWALKKNKPQGRLITDPTYSDFGVACLNSKKTRELVELEWDPIVHPTLEDIMRIILLIKDRQGHLVSSVLWKMDLANAFGLLDVHPESIRLCCNALENNLTVMYTQGWFGWSGTPFAFDVISRSLRNRLRVVLKGVVHVYVDDIFGCCLESDLEHELRTTKETTQSLLGPSCIAEEKTESGRILEIIGWSFDLDKERVFLARHNFLKTFYGFFEVDLANPVSFITMERLASWASRYSAVAPVMKPHIGGLYRMLIGVTERRKPLIFTEEAIRDITLWRTFLAAAWQEPEKFARPFESFRPAPAEVNITFDASLHGLGFLIDRRDPSGDWSPWVALKFYPLPFFLEKSDFQNVMEFLALTIALVFLAKMGYRHTRISLVGDSETALAWAGGNAFKGVLVARPATVFTCLGLHFGNNIEQVRHIPGADNDIADALSRNYRTTDKGVEVEGYLLAYGYEFKDITEQFKGIVEMCNPTLPLESVEKYTELWSLILKWCNPPRRPVD